MLRIITKAKTKQQQTNLIVRFLMPLFGFFRNSSAGSPTHWHATTHTTTGKEHGIQIKGLVLVVCRR
jgi:hypothetical protein